VPGRQLELIQTAATPAGPAYDVLDLCWNGDWQDRRGPHMMLVFGAARLPGISLEFGGVAVPVRESARHFLYLAVPWVRDSACVQGAPLPKWRHELV
jgi:hypothetical protein